MTTLADEPKQKGQTQLRQVEIKSEPVELYKILKFEGLVTSGGQAKGVIAAGKVRVNGTTETQKRKKIVGGDTIEFDNKKFAIKLRLPMLMKDPKKR